MPNTFQVVDNGNWKNLVAHVIRDADDRKTASLVGLRTALATIPRKEADAVILRWGLSEKGVMTIKDIAFLMDKSTDRVTQYLRQGENKLRSAHYRQMITPVRPAWQSV